MNLCIPIDENLGLESAICLHFSTAPKLMVIDPETLSFEIFENPDCAPDEPRNLLSFLREFRVTSVVVGGIGVAVLDYLNAAGISVFSSTEDKVSEIVDAFNKGTINPVTLGAPCHGASAGRRFSIPGCGRKYGGQGGGCTGGC